MGKEMGQEKAVERKPRSIKLSDEAVSCALAYAKEHHLSGGLSGAIEYIVFQVSKG